MKRIGILAICLHFVLYGSFVKSQSLCDQVVLELVGYQGGNIQWESSTDSINWSPIQCAGTTFLSVFAENSTYFRAVVYNGTCPPYYSEIIKNVKPEPYTQEEIDLVFSGEITQAMPIMNIYNHDDSLILRKQSIPMEPCGDSLLLHLKERMLKTVTGVGVGIAAPQVGVNRQCAWVQRQDKGTFVNRPFEFYINPRIVAMSDTLVLRNDGCLSVPTGAGQPVQITKTYRAIWVVVDYNLVGGENVRELITHQYTAHIFQHEIDHLNGIMYFDHDGSKKILLDSYKDEEYYEGMPFDTGLYKE